MRRTWSKQRPLVLVLDDDKVSRAVVAGKVRAFADVVEASGEAEALQLLGSRDVDLAVVDLELECGSGYSFIRSLRLRAHGGAIPVIVLTGTERRGALEESLDAGATSFLVKPLNWATFGRHIQQISEIAFRAGYMALHDHLTGLPNRVQLGEKASHLLQSAKPASIVTTFALDLDRFKPINDSFGHFVGDQVLIEVGLRLRSIFPTADVVARVGGDEFIVVGTVWKDRQEAAAAADALIEDLKRPFVVGGHYLTIGCSIGIDHRRIDDLLTPEQILKDADLALGEAKRGGRNTFRFFEEQMSIAALVRTAMEISIRQAIDDQQFRLSYQPIKDLKSGAIRAFEALIRWQHPTLGQVAPDRFLPIAEEAGLVGNIGGWALVEACCAGTRFGEEINIAVNVSPQQLHKRMLLDQVKHALDTSGLAPNRLELEIVESVLLDNSDATLSTLEGLRSLGVRIAIDDFGTGYSSLGYLERFKFDKIKIDRSFISKAVRSSGARSVIAAVGNLARGHGIISTAEGVETEEQLAIVREELIDEAQGYFFGRPMPEADIHSLLQALAHREREAAKKRRSTSPAKRKRNANTRH